MIKNLCTLLDKNYVYKALALYSSVIRHYPKFCFFMLCMDNETYTLLKKMRLKHVKLISLKQFEDRQLLSVKKSRTHSEYCWTSTASLPLYIFKHFPEIGEVTYLDSDLYFFESPKQIYIDFGNNSIFLIPHRHSRKYKHLEKVHGKYNVGLLVFKNDKNGISCLRYWRKKCLEWCYSRREYHKYGDQFYLNDFPKLFKKVYVSDNIGFDVAPWNISDFIVCKKNNHIFINNERLVFYHFANVKIYNEYKFKPLPKNSLFQMSHKNTKLIYKPYFNDLSKAIRCVRRYDSKFNWGVSEDINSLKYKFKFLAYHAKSATKEILLIFVKQIIQKINNLHVYRKL